MPVTLLHVNYTHSTFYLKLHILIQHVQTTCVKTAHYLTHQIQHIQIAQLHVLK